MANYSHTLSPLLLLIALSSIIRSSSAAGIAVYWGRNGTREGTLADACNTGNYNYVLIGYLKTFGNGRPPILDFTTHCNPASGGCTSMSNDIKICQRRGVKVLLSIGGDNTEGYSLSSATDARHLAHYLWNNFLGGNSSTRPLGDAVLDGIDFDIETGAGQPWDELARALSGFSSLRRKVYLSAAPVCLFPDPNMDSALRTGVFDYIWVAFMDSPGCEYDGESVDSLLASWNQWMSEPGGKIFMGLPAAPEAGTGFIPPHVLISEVLPVIKSSPKYGGLAMWTRLYDCNNGYSSVILPHIQPQTLPSLISIWK